MVNTVDTNNERKDEMARQTPEGYMEDPQGRLIPVDMVKEIDRERDSLVRDIAAAARQQSEALARFKSSAMGDIGAFCELSAEKYGARVGGKKGNIQLLSFDGSLKVLVAIAEHLAFDERLQAAKSLIDECIHEWAEGSRPEIKTLINDAFSVDRQGKLNTNRILGLRRLDIQHPKWQKAMQAIGESLTVVGSKSYIRIYERQADGSYKQINLDLAAL